MKVLLVIDTENAEQVVIYHKMVSDNINRDIEEALLEINPIESWNSDTIAEIKDGLLYDTGIWMFEKYRFETISL